MNIKPKEKIPGKAARKPPKKITESYLHNAGLYYLQRFAASSGRFRDVMMRKVKKSCAHHTDQNQSQCQEMVDALVVKFESSGLLNDESYASGAVNSLRRQGRSKRAIEARLAGKGVKSDLIQAKLKDYDYNKQVQPEETELEAALMLARRKKLGPYRVKADYSPEKEMATLARAGFSYEIASKVLKISEMD